MLENVVVFMPAKIKPGIIIIGTPLGSNCTVEAASNAAGLVQFPTGVSPLDMKHTQATLSGTYIPAAFVLVNVEKRERLLYLAH